MSAEGWWDGPWWDEPVSGTWWWTGAEYFLHTDSPTAPAPTTVTHVHTWGSSDGERCRGSHPGGQP